MLLEGTHCPVSVQSGLTVDRRGEPPLIQPGTTVWYTKERRNGATGGYPAVDVLNKAGVRDAAEGVNVGAEFYDALDARAQELIDRAVERAQAYDRKTVKTRDV